MRVRGNGYSVLEVMVALGIIAVVGLAALGAVTSSAKEVKTTSEYSLSIFLSQKVGEELIQDASDNLRYEEALAELSGVRLPIEQNLHPYFSALEDSRAPFGVLEPGTDLGIEPVAPSLFQLYRYSALTLGATPTGIPGVSFAIPPLQSVNILYDWPGLKQNERDFLLPMWLARTAVRTEATPLVAQDIPGLNDAIRSAFYPNSSGDLATVVTQVDGQLLVVSDIGAIVEVTSAANTQCSSLAASIQTTKAMIDPAHPNPEKDAETYISLGHLYEQRAAIQWLSLLYEKGPAVRNENSFKSSDLGRPGSYDGYTIHEGISEADGLWSGFQADSQWALYEYGQARNLMSGDTTRAYRRMILDRKILELIKLRILVSANNDTTLLIQWMDYLLPLYTGRIRSFADYLARERISALSYSSLQAANSVVASRVNDATTAASALDKLKLTADTELGP